MIEKTHGHIFLQSNGFVVFFNLQIEEAGQVFLLMKKDYRISRNVRLAWFLGHLHQVICSMSEAELVSKFYCKASKHFFLRGRSRKGLALVILGRVIHVWNSVISFNFCF